MTPGAATAGSRRHEAGSVRAAAGQASVELVALLPLLLVVALAVFSVIAAGSADEEAGAAAEAGALALIQGGDPRAAATAALPASARPRATIAIHGSHVHVQVRSRLPLPGLADRLAGDADSDAGRAAP
jgi:Flp pilus assembly protein TadG